MNVAIIPARGGSKRLTRKNIRIFCGKPVIEYSIEAAKNAGIFDRIIVSTDDLEIASVALQAGADVPFIRPAALSDDLTTTVPVIKHAIEWLQGAAEPINNVCCLYATAPFVQASHLRAAYGSLIGRFVSGYVFSATSFPFPIQRAFRLDDKGYVTMFEPQNYARRSQDLERAYQDAGQFYWGSAQAYLSDKIFFSSDSVAYLLPRYLVQDIDTPEDWTRAELMYRVIQDSGIAP